MAKKELTLKDRLSRLTFAQAYTLLGPDGNKLIMRGGKFEITSIEDNVYLGDDLFRLSVDGAVVTITLMAQARKRLHFNCNKCKTVYELNGHIQLILSILIAISAANINIIYNNLFCLQFFISTGFLSITLFFYHN